MAKTEENQASQDPKDSRGSSSPTPFYMSWVSPARAVLTLVLTILSFLVLLWGIIIVVRVIAG